MTSQEKSIRHGHVDDQMVQGFSHSVFNSKYDDKELLKIPITQRITIAMYLAFISRSLSGSQYLQFLDETLFSVILELSTDIHHVTLYRH